VLNITNFNNHFLGGGGQGLYSCKLEHYWAQICETQLADNWSQLQNTGK
jgi:hypothetical protein